MSQHTPPLHWPLVCALAFSFLVCSAAFIGWAQANQWQFGVINLYTIFPLLGLVAFSILWSQYMVVAFAKFKQINHKRLSGYFVITGWVFLLCIFLHPGLLVWQLWQDGFGLPPKSYLEHYIAPGLAWAALLGSVSFLLFLAYELRRWFHEKPWWKFVVYATDIAAIAIFIHSLKLGTALQTGWFQTLWFLYGITLTASLIYLRIMPLFQKGKD